MTTRLLYHAFGIRGYRYRTARQEKGITTLVIEAPRLACAACGSANVIRSGGHTRRWHHVPIGFRPTFIEMHVPRLECHECGVTRQLAVTFAEPRKQHTKTFARLAIDLAQHMTIHDTARFLRVGWDMIKEILKVHLQRRFADPLRKRVPRRIAIDEIAVHKGHRYLTIVLDLETGAVVFVGTGKAADALQPFFDRLGQKRRRIRAVAMDLSQAYQNAVRANLPQAIIVFDRFHIVKLLNEKLSDLRRDLQREAVGQAKKALKGVRWLLLKRPGNLDARRNERHRLQAALRLNAPLSIAYYLKEDLDRFWRQSGKAAAELFLDEWVRDATATGIRVLQVFARTLQIHRRGLLDWYDEPISTGPLEGINHKIKNLKRQAYGYRDLAFFRLRIFALHEARYALVG
ncbi:MAG: ISL3 family transposase [Planctomycetota bacterium]